MSKVTTIINEIEQVDETSNNNDVYQVVVDTVSDEYNDDVQVGFIFLTFYCRNNFKFCFKKIVDGSLLIINLLTEINNKINHMTQ
jgi:hypothetical protein